MLTRGGSWAKTMPQLFAEVAGRLAQPERMPPCRRATMLANAGSNGRRFMSDALEVGRFVTVIERANDRGEGIHQLELLLFHIAREQASCIGRELEESTVELLGEFATEWPQRVERFPN